MNTNKSKTPWIALIAALAVIAVVAIVVVLSANSPAKKYQKQLELAERYLEDLDYDQAIAAYRAAIAIDPKNPEAYEALAELYIDQGEDEKALEILNAGVEETQAEELKKLVSETETRIAEAEAAKEEAARAAYIESITSDEGYIVFGHYEQDGDESNGPESIEWEVLEDNGDSMLLISRYILDAQLYNTECTDITWENCSLRKWMNYDFLNAAFTPEEQGRIKTVTISNPDNTYSGTEGGNDTEDKLFLLSVEEIINRYSFNYWNDEYQYGYCQGLITDTTALALNNVGAFREYWTITQEEYDNLLVWEGYDESCIGRAAGPWWLRSPGVSGSMACFVGINGVVGMDTSYDVDFHYGVRPAFYLEK